IPPGVDWGCEVYWSSISNITRINDISGLKLSDQAKEQCAYLVDDEQQIHSPAQLSLFSRLILAGLCPWPIIDPKVGEFPVMRCGALLFDGRKIIVNSREKVGLDLMEYRASKDEYTIMNLVDGRLVPEGPDKYPLPPAGRPGVMFGRGKGVLACLRRTFARGGDVFFFRRTPYWIFSVILLVSFLFLLFLSPFGKEEFRRAPPSCFPNSFAHAYVYPLHVKAVDQPPMPTVNPTVVTSHPIDVVTEVAPEDTGLVPSSSSPRHFLQGRYRRGLGEFFEGAYAQLEQSNPPLFASVDSYLALGLQYANPVDWDAITKLSPAEMSTLRLAHAVDADFSKARAEVEKLDPAMHQSLTLNTPDISMSEFLRLQSERDVAVKARDEVQAAIAEIKGELALENKKNEALELKLKMVRQEAKVVHNR
ncbi:hypothetical protein CCACVL1_00057, partial [Corchorus capsularis]